MQYETVDVDALGSAARYVSREWGEEAGYRARIAGSTLDGAILEVSWRDGSRFYVWSDRWGNTAHGDTMADVLGNRTRSAV